MASRLSYLFLIPLLFCQNICGQVVPIGNGCICQKSPVPQNQLINLQLPIPGCNCQNNLPFYNLPANQLPVVNGFQINNGLPLNNRPPFTNFMPVGNLPAINNFPVNNLPAYNNVPITNLPVFNNAPIGYNLPNNIPPNRLPPLNNIHFTNLPVRNNLPKPYNLNYLPNSPLNNLLVNCINSNGMPINLPYCIQLINNVPFQNNPPINNINPRLQNFNVVPVNNLAIGPPNNIQITNLPVNQPNYIQFTNVPNGLNLNQLPNGANNQQNLQNVPVNNDCGCNHSGLSALVENGLANSPGNPPNNAPVVTMNGLQLGGLGGLGNLPLFNGLPVIGVQESVVNLNPQCNCQN